MFWVVQNFGVKKSLNVGSGESVGVIVGEEVEEEVVEDVGDVVSGFDSDGFSLGTGG